MAKDTFTQDGVEAYEKTFSTLFEQANRDCGRLQRINAALETIEETLLDPERITNMNVLEQVALADLLGRSQTATVGNLLRFGDVLLQIKTVVGTFDGLKRHAVLPSEEARRFPMRTFDHDSD